MLERPITSRIALSATAFTVPSGFWMLNRKSPTPSGLIRHSTVKSTSTMFSSPVSIRLSSGHVAHRSLPRRDGSSIRRHADVDGGDAQRLRQQHGLDRIRQMIVQAGLHRAHMLAEAQHDAEFVGLHAEEARQSHRSPARRAAMMQRCPCRRDCRPAARAAACPGRGAAGPRDRAASARPIAGPNPTAPSDRNPMGHHLDSSTASTLSFARAQRHNARPRNDLPGFIGDRPGPLQRALAWLEASYA